MGDRTEIEWADATWNPIRARQAVTGKVGWACTKVSSGCTYCYAERLNRLRGTGEAYTAKGNERVELFLDERVLAQPLRWRRPRRVFVCSMGDLFEAAIPLSWIAEVFNVMASATLDCGKRHRHEEECWGGPHHTYIVLTKRAEQMHKIITEELPDYAGNFWSGDTSLNIALSVNWPLQNVWLGVSAETQEYADARIPWLLKTTAAVRFVSVEPMLGPIDLTGITFPPPPREGIRPVNATVEYDALKGSRLTELGIEYEGGTPLSWVIAGGESGGPPERALVIPCLPCHGSGWAPKPEALAWVRALRDQVKSTGRLFFFKQWGGPRPTRGGRLLDGREWNEMPEATR